MQRRCVICGRTFEDEGEGARGPFCSPRCKLADLGAWLDERYRVALPDEAEGSGSLTPESEPDNGAT